MKKFLALLLSVMLVLGALAACNNQEQPDNEKDGLTLAKDMVRAQGRPRSDRVGLSGDRVDKYRQR